MLNYIKLTNFDSLLANQATSYQILQSDYNTQKMLKQLKDNPYLSLQELMLILHLTWSDFVEEDKRKIIEYDKNRRY